MSVLDQFFTDNTTSVHLQQDTFIRRKWWKPGEWKMETLEKETSKDFLMQIIDDIYREIADDDKSFCEIDRKYSKVLQLGKYRIVVVLPPVSDCVEITIVRPLTRLTFEDYNLNDNLVDLIANNAKWILVAGSPGEGKTTFAQALVDFYMSQNKIVKTIESPRDLQVWNDVTQYSFSYAPHSEIRDILLLSRPDYSIYDEVRNPEDFQLYKDLRLTGIGLVGVTHATKPINAIQRLVGIVEMGIIPEVVDTIFFIKWGKVDSTYILRHTVKVPYGMMSDDLARPVIEVLEFFSNKVKYEIYSYGEEVVTIPIDEEKDLEIANKKAPLLKYAKTYVEDFLYSKYNFPILIEMNSERNVTLYCSDSNKGKLIGKWGETIMKTEKELGFNISVRNINDLENKQIFPETNFKKTNKKELCLDFGKELAGEIAYLVSGGKIKTFAIDNKWMICIRKKKDINIINWNESFWVVL